MAVLCQPKAMKTSIVFFGNEKLATGIADSQSVILEGLQQAGYEIEAHIKERDEIAKRYDSQIAILAAFGRIIPQPLLDQFPLGIINVHPSLLPLYRGSTPIEQAILSGDQETGVSIMKLVNKMDAGPIYAQSAIKLGSTESKAELTVKLQKLGAELLTQTLPRILDGTTKPQTQDESQATYCKRIAKADGEIGWVKPAEQIEREIRAYLGWPGSYTKLGGKDVIITQAHAVPDSQPSKNPGDFDTDNDGFLKIQCGKGYLCVEKLKPAGKREMTTAEFLAGNKL